MKLVIIGDLRDVIDSYNREEISYSKMAEILNNKANERLQAINYSQCCMGEAEQLPQDKFCKVCNLPTDGEKCYSKKCPV